MQCNTKCARHTCWASAGHTPLAVVHHIREEKLNWWSQTLPVVRIACGRASICRRVRLGRTSSDRSLIMQMHLPLARRADVVRTWPDKLRANQGCAILPRSKRLHRILPRALHGDDMDPALSTNSCPVPADQQPVREYKLLQETLLFNWATLPLPEFVVRLGAPNSDHYTTSPSHSCAHRGCLDHIFCHPRPPRVGGDLQHQYAAYRVRSLSIHRLSLYRQHRRHTSLPGTIIDT